MSAAWGKEYLNTEFPLPRWIQREAKTNYIYSAEELERRENANRSRGPPDSTPPTASWHFFTWIDSQGTKLWMPVLGSTALMGLLALLYKNMGKLKAYIWKTKTCDSYTPKRASVSIKYVCRSYLRE